MIACELESLSASQSKIATEKIIENYNLLFGLKYTILRYATAYGENNRGVDVVSIFIKTKSY